MSEMWTEEKGEQIRKTWRDLNLSQLYTEETIKLNKKIEELQAEVTKLRLELDEANAEITHLNQISFF